MIVLWFIFREVEATIVNTFTTTQQINWHSQCTHLLHGNFNS